MQHASHRYTAARISDFGDECLVDLCPMSNPADDVGLWTAQDVVQMREACTLLTDSLELLHKVPSCCKP